MWSGRYSVRPGSRFNAKVFYCVVAQKCASCCCELFVFALFSLMGTHGPSKNPPSTPKDSQGPPRDLPGISQGPPRRPTGPHRDPQGATKNRNMLQTYQEPIRFQCFHQPPHGDTRALQAHLKHPNKHPEQSLGPPRSSTRISPDLL